MTVTLESVFVYLCSYSEVRADQSVQDVDDGNKHSGRIYTNTQVLSRFMFSASLKMFCWYRTVSEHVIRLLKENESRF